MTQLLRVVDIVKYTKVRKLLLKKQYQIMLQDGTVLINGQLLQLL
jgi:hypothetical protein